MRRPWTPPTQASPPAGYYITVTSGSTDTNNEFGNFRQGTKSGFKFEDQDADGDFNEDTDPAPRRLDDQRPSTTRTATASSMPVTTTPATTTDTTAHGTGAYTLQPRPGDYVICEVAPGHLDPVRAQRRHGATGDCSASTDPPASAAGYAITVSSQSTDENNDFGNYRPARSPATSSRTRTPTATYDADTDPRLDGWTIKAFADKNGDGILDPDGADNNLATVADNDVQVASVVTGTGAWTDASTSPASPPATTSSARWPRPPGPSRRPAAPARPATARPTRPSGAAGYAITVSSQSTDENNDFGNYKAGTKSGYKFEDKGADGTYDADTDPRLDGWTIKAFADKNGDGILDPDGADNNLATVADNDVQVASVVTGTGAWADGFYQFSLDPGDYVVCEVAQATWTQSAPSGAGATGDCSADTTLGAAGYAITVSCQSTDENNNFGNYKAGTKSGYKFEDKDADGTYDAGTDPRLDGWTIRPSPTRTATASSIRRRRQQPGHGR